MPPRLVLRSASSRSPFCFPAAPAALALATDGVSSVFYVATGVRDRNASRIRAAGEIRGATAPELGDGPSASPGTDVLAAWAEQSHRQTAEPGRGRLRFAFYGRVSTEEWQDPVTSRSAHNTQPPLPDLDWTTPPKRASRAPTHPCWVSRFRVSQQDPQPHDTSRGGEGPAPESSRIEPNARIPGLGPRSARDDDCDVTARQPSADGPRPAAGRLSTELGDTGRAPVRLPSRNARHPDAARPLALSSRIGGSRSRSSGVLPVADDAEDS